MVTIATCHANLTRETRVVLSVLLLVTGTLAAQQIADSTLEDAAAVYQQGKTAEAEQLLRNIVSKRLDDLGAFVLLGTVLDTEQRYKEAETYFARALKIAPASAQVLNDFGNHYLSTGDRSHAREMYLKALASDPHHVNASLQLAQMSVDDRQGKLALSYLDRVGGAAGSEPGPQLLRARALAICARCTEASEILKTLAPSTQAPLQFSAGLALVQCKLFGAAEESFLRALDADPQNFDVLYNLGLAALLAGHYERAQSTLENALKQRPADADVLFALAQLSSKRGRFVESAALLRQAQKAAPERADVLLLLAQVLARSELYEDSAAAYSRYLELRPQDDAARRERGFDFARAHESRIAIADLEWYLARHPRDATGCFELAVAEIFENRPRALTLVTRAIELDPTLYQALYTRGVMNLEDGKPRQAIPDFELYLKKDPNNFRALADLGEADLLDGRNQDALDVLSRARQIAPLSTLVLIRYAQALEKLGHGNEARAVWAQLNQYGGRDQDSPHRADPAAYLNSSPSGQRVHRLSGLRASSAAEPGNVQLKVALARELLAQGATNEALAIFEHLPPAALEPSLMAECGNILVDFELFDQAVPYLEHALAAKPGESAARLNLAIALFNLRGADAALGELDKTAAEDRHGDYYLLRAEILDAQGKLPEAAVALNQGMRAAPARASLYYGAAGFLLKHKLYQEAKTLLEQASRVRPGDRELQLAQAVTLYLLRRNPEAESLLDKMQARWPDWGQVYLLKGILLEIALRSAEARQALETAITLGVKTPEAFYYDALAITHLTPEDLDAASDAIGRALTLESQDPYICLLAGKISLERKEYAAAVERLLQATHLEPDLIPAHYALRHAYSALGEEQKSAAEIEAIKHLAKNKDGADEGPFSAQDFLFSVQRPE